MSAIVLYVDHFELERRPFSLVPDPGFLHWSPAHKRAYSVIEYGLEARAPITLLTGDVGAGKTTLLHHVLNGMRKDAVVGLVSNAQGGRGEVLRWVMMALGQAAGAQEGYVDLFSRFQDFLIARYAEGKRVVLIFDEAQNLGREALEELRMFTNINSGEDELVQLILVGQPELRRVVEAPDLTQFAQRISASFHLEPLDAEGVRAFIHHRLRVAGARRQIFTDAACGAVHAATGGVPRLVNKLCDLSMVYAFSDDATIVDADTVGQVLADGMLVGAPAPPPAPAPAATPGGAPGAASTPAPVHPPRQGGAAAVRDVRRRH